MSTKYSNKEYYDLRECSKGHIIYEIIEGILAHKPKDIAEEIEGMLLKEEFISSTTKEMLRYMYEMPIDEIPLHINESNNFFKPIILWRLKIGK